MTDLKRCAFTSLSLSAVLAAGCAAPPPVPMSHLVVGDLEGPEATVAFVTAERAEPSDAEVAVLAHAELARMLGPHARELKVAFADGQLTLDGPVDSLAVHDAALEVAARLRDVSVIVDEIDVNVPDVSDASIRQGLAVRLRRSPATERLDIDVTVKDGEVTLRGRVDSAQEQRLAVALARRVRGVSAVRNQIVFEPKPRSDAEITADVAAALRDDLFLGDDPIDVTVDDGRVTLSGSTGSLSERQRAEAIAWLSGVKDVHVGGIEVRFDGPAPHIRRAPVPMGDEEAQRAIVRTLAYDPIIPQRDIDVRVHDGRVVLTGVVPRYDVKRAAEEAARRNRIGEVIDNRIEVRPESRFTDDYLETALGEALAEEPVVDANDVSVEIIGGVATLRGTLDSVLERRAALQAASEVAGVTEVRDELQTKHYFEPSLTTPDARIARSVETALLTDPWISGAHLVISVDDGHVFLSGVVDDELSRRRAIEDAHDAGAEAVVPRLAVVDTAAQNPTDS